jgi:hypothetical protein
VFFGTLLLCYGVHSYYWAHAGIEVLGVGHHVYPDGSSTVINSKKELDDYIESIRQARKLVDENDNLGEWAALSRVNIDFSTKTLVLVRHKEGTSSIDVRFGSAYVLSNTLICNVRRSFPSIGRTRDMAYYCFPVLVDKGRAVRVEIRVDGETKSI